VFIHDFAARGVVRQGDVARAFHTEAGHLLGLEIVALGPPSALTRDDILPPSAYADQLNELRARFR
jgi:hypothetical protein